MAIEDAKPSVEPVLKSKKKAEMIKAKMKGTSLDAIAKASGVAIQQAVDMTIETGNIPNAGPEKKVIGTAFAIGLNKVSAPIEGNSGIFVVKPTAITKAPALPNHTEYIAKVKSQVAGYSGRVIPALKENADIEDNRPQFNY
jgi:peptidyl-prolyl cis-trans isomerase D